MSQNRQESCFTSKNLHPMQSSRSCGPTVSSSGESFRELTSPSSISPRSTFPTPQSPSHRGRSSVFISPSLLGRGLIEARLVFRGFNPYFKPVGVLRTRKEVYIAYRGRVPRLSPIPLINFQYTEVLYLAFEQKKCRVGVGGG